MKRICMWSGPRNVSTALMYSFGNRPDIIAIDEPFYAYYLVKSNLEHPGWEETLESQSYDYLDVVKNVLYQKSDKPIMYIKNMTHHTIDMSLDFMNDLLNLFLIRDPREVIASYIKTIPQPTMQDLGYERQWQLVEHIINLGKKPFIVDSSELLTNPRIILIKMCDYLNIEFRESMLQWEAGPRSFDGVWAKYWYKNVHLSTGFNKYENKTVRLTSQYKSLEKECRVFYERLKAMGTKCYD